MAQPPFATPEPLPALDGERVALRPTTADDAETIAAILAEPDVARWWGSNDVAGVGEELRSQSSFAIVVDDAVVGWLQIHEETEPTYPSVAFDIALTTSLHGQGYGGEALRVAIAYFAARGHHRFTIDPAADNERAIRSYARVGFQPVGIMRAYERSADGGWRDGLLMDLLAEDLA